MSSSLDHRLQSHAARSIRGRVVFGERELTERLQPAGLGIPTLHTRVENWECDFNNHWNARFYARSFQLAAETLPQFPDVTRHGDVESLTRYIRFHRELFAGASVEVRSAQLADGPYCGAIVHLLSSGDRLSATALDIGGLTVEGLPRIEGDALRLAYPRSLGRPDAGWEDGSGTSICETGPIRPAELDHRRILLFEDIVRRAAVSTHNHVSALGLNETLLKETGISRMAVESRVTRLGSLPAGTPLRVRTRIPRLGAKSFVVAHMLESHASEPIAFVEHSILTVNLNTRRAVELPDFLQKLIG